MLDVGYVLRTLDMYYFPAIGYHYSMIGQIMCIKIEQLFLRTENIRPRLTYNQPNPHFDFIFILKWFRRFSFGQIPIHRLGCFCFPCRNAGPLWSFSGGVRGQNALLP